MAYDYYSREPEKTSFTRLGINYELIDTMGFIDYGNFEYDNFFKYYDNDIKCADYIILIVSFECLRIKMTIQKFIENLIKKFTPEKFFSHLCIVFTKYDPEDSEEKEILIKNFTKLLNDMGKDKINCDPKFYFVNTRFKNNNFVFEKYQDTIDIMLKEIKLACDFY